MLGVSEFVAKVGQGEVDAFDFAEPALVLGALAAVLKVGFDVGEPGDHLEVDVEHGAADAGVFVGGHCHVVERGHLGE